MHTSTGDEELGIVPRRNKMKARSLAFNLAAWGLLLAMAPAMAGLSDEEIAKRLRDCAKLEGQEVRAECLQALADESLRDDKVGKKAAAVDAPGAEMAETPTAANDNMTILETNEKPIQGVLSDCRRSYSGVYLFYFEDGQIWKQVDSRRKRFKNCDWPVTIVKDAFGYKLLVDADSYVRVRRLK